MVACDIKQHLANVCVISYTVSRFVNIISIGMVSQSLGKLAAISSLRVNTEKEARKNGKRQQKRMKGRKGI